MKCGKKTISLLLCGAMLLAGTPAVFAEENQNDISKQESIYLILNPDGTVRTQTVSCWLHHDGGLKGITDKSKLNEINNLKSDVKPGINGETVTWDTGDSDVYYQGKSSQTPPITMDISYTMNGKKVTEQELRGKSGSFSMTIKLHNNQKKQATISGKEKTIYTPFVVGMVLDFPTKNFKNVSAGANNTIISDSTNQLVSLISAPGLKENFDGILSEEWKELSDKLQDTFTIRAEVTDFTYPMFMAAAATNLADLEKINLNDTVSSLEDGMEQLESAAGQLKDGTNRLAAALNQFDGKMGEFQNSYQAFDAGLLEAVSGASQLQSGTKQLSEAINQLKTKANEELVSGIKGSATLQQQLVTKMEALKKELAGLKLPDMTALEQQLTAAIEEVSNGSADVAVQVMSGGQKTLQGLLQSKNPQEQAMGRMILQNLESKVKQPAKKKIAAMLSSLDLSQLERLKTALSEIDALSSQLMTGVSKLTSALYDPNDNLQNPKTMVGAIMALSVGAGQAASGAGSLKEGTNKLAGASAKIKEAISQFETATGQLVSGSEELKNGAAEFKSSGIDKLCDNQALADIRTAIEIKDAMQEQADAFHSYAGAPEQAEVSTAFVIKVAEKTEETQEQEVVEKKAEEGFFQKIWNSIVRFFQNLFS